MGLHSSVKKNEIIFSGKGMEMKLCLIRKTNFIFSSYMKQRCVCVCVFVLTLRKEEILRVGRGEEREMKSVYKKAEDGDTQREQGS